MIDEDILLLGKIPISQDSPVGDDVKNDSEFRLLKQTIGNYPIDWNLVIELSESILSSKSKNIYAAACLSIALIHNHKIKGLEGGLTIINDLLHEYWDDLHPKASRGRFGAINFWKERALKEMQAFSQKKISDEQSEILIKVIESIEEFLNNCQSMPSLAEFRRSIRDIPVEKKDPPPKQKKVEKNQFHAPKATKKMETVQTDTAEPEIKSDSEPSENQEAQTELPEAPQSQTIENEQSVSDILENSFQVIGQVSDYLFEKMPLDPRAYKYKRMEAWSRIEGVPPQINDKTGIPGPSIEEQNIIKALIDEKDWFSLLRLSEQKIGQHNFWIDLNRFSATALEGLGSKYKKAYDAVCKETAFFVHNFQGIEQCFFADGKPFADDDTKLWLKKNSLGGQSVSGSGISFTSDDDHSMAQEIKTAYDIYNDGNISEALKILKSRLQGCVSIKQKFLWRLSIGKLLAEANENDLAIVYFDLILRDIEDFGLEEWDKDLSIQSFVAAYPIYHNSQDEIFQIKAADIMNRIGRLDVNVALELKSSQ